MWDNWRLWQSAGEGCASAAGASLPANTQCWCAGGNPRGNCIFSYPWEDHKVTTYEIFSYQHLLVFSSDAGIILHRALDMRLIYWEHQNKVGKTGVPLGHVSVSFCNIRSVNFHLCHHKDARNKPHAHWCRCPQVSRNSPSWLNPTATVDEAWETAQHLLMVATLGIRPRCCCHCQCDFYLIPFIWNLPQTAK